MERINTFIQINIIGDSLFVNRIYKNKLKNTFYFSVVDLISNESTKQLFKNMILNHYKEEYLQILVEDYRYLKGLKLL